MNSRERIAGAMRREEPDRVPLMCQLSLGHYFLATGLDPVDIWHDTRTFGFALVTLQQRYEFDGILINLPGRDPDWRDQVCRIDVRDGDAHVLWTNGVTTIVPPDDNPRLDVAQSQLSAVRPEDLYYVEPYDLMGLHSMCTFPSWQYDTTECVRHAVPHVSVHAEVFSPFTQMLELLGYEQALVALIDEPDKMKECLAALCRGTTDLMLGHARAGADAILISSAFAGAGFISRDHYQQFVLPYERCVIGNFATVLPTVPVYTHTCGSIGDRLDLIAETGTRGIDTLDPPPLGNIDLAAAKRQIGDRLFIKGNMDPVNTLLMGTPDAVYHDAVARMAAAADGGGYILSTACSVPPRTPCANIRQLARAVADHGWYA